MLKTHFLSFITASNESPPYSLIVLNVGNVSKIPYLTKTVKHYRQGVVEKLFFPSLFTT
jgi:hypothetical protein